MERGDFDDPPGAGKPIPGLNEPDDEMVGGLSVGERGPHVPPARPRLASRGGTWPRGGPPGDIRGQWQIIEGVNEQIREANRRGAGDPAVLLAPYDVDGVVERWRQRRS